MDEFTPPEDDLRREIAMAAARLIAEDGLDYGSACNQAVRSVAGRERLARDRIPSHAEIQDEVRAYQALFLADTQPGELRDLREITLQLMHKLAHFEPIVYGALVNGTGSAHSDIHLLVFSDDEKEVDYWLLNQNMAFDACEDALLAGKVFPAVAFQWKNRWVQLGVASPAQRRGLLNRSSSEGSMFQTDIAGLTRLLEA
ncbi:hypothetical protein NQT62_11230 [Limnobacter humi]|uniref:Nucleotidyltransferase domain-containing protein n=1 Tax=Limnobacter humi TaxID=1778671 RepID=A0ABT1WHN1_9BURK|nr:hypothetical protein [Limnobacter humi]MCQ8897005.1 hypothetical protein [Limnobacter humi]